MGADLGGDIKVYRLLLAPFSAGLERRKEKEVYTAYKKTKNKTLMEQNSQSCEDYHLDYESFHLSPQLTR